MPHKKLINDIKIPYIFKGIITSNSISHNQVQPIPNIGPMFVHHNLWCYIKCGGKYLQYFLFLNL